MKLPLAGALLVSALIPLPANAQLQDQSWQPWYGCWRADAAAAGELLCIAPEEGGVRMATVQGGTVRAETRVITDGRARPIEAANCEGTELATWSADGRRVFLSSELSCDNNTGRKVSGIFSFTGLNEWLSVQAVLTDGRVSTRTVRYRPAERTAMPAQFVNALRRAPVVDGVDAEDVSEAVRAVDAPAVQEWLSAQGLDFQLDEDSSAGASATYYTSALDYLGTTSGGQTYARPASERQVVQVVERPVYVTRPTRVVWVDDCWSPWGYDSWGWRVYARPVISIHIGPVIIRRGPYIVGHVRHHPVYVYDRTRWYDYDYYYGRDRDRYRYDRDRYYTSDRERDRYNEPRDRIARERNGDVTREGYRGPRERERTYQPPRNTGVSIGIESATQTMRDRYNQPRRDDTRTAQPREPRETRSAPVAPTTRANQTPQRERLTTSKPSSAGERTTTTRTARPRTN